MKSLNNYNTRILFLLIIDLLVIYFIYYANHSFKCIFESTFHLPCFGCEMTKAFDYLYNGNYYQFMVTNYFALPLVLVMISLHIGFLYDFIKQCHQFYQIIIALINKYYRYIIGLLLTIYIVQIID